MATEIEHLSNYLTTKLEELGENYGYISDKRIALFYDNIPSPLNEFFTYFHVSLNDLLTYLNSRMNNGHYTALESRVLFKLITELKNVKNNLIDTDFDFELDTKYNDCLQQCESFLQTSGGSPIPKGFEKVEIIELSPIFTLKTSISIERSTKKFLFPTKVIGEGSYARVLKYKDTYYNCFFAIKQAFDDLSEKEYERFQIEFEQMRRLNSPYILKVYNFNSENHQYTMEYANHSLDSFITKHNSTINMSHRLYLINQIFNAFRYIHSKGLLHRDISPSNILIKNYEDSDIIKVSDFGLVKIKDSKLTSPDSDLKGSFNDPKLSTFGFANYEIRHETYALTRLIHFVVTGNRKIISFPNPEFESFIRKGIADNIEERYGNVQVMQDEFQKIRQALRQVNV